MSRLNKVNPDHYTMAGRLSADDLARERMRQGASHSAPNRRGGRPMPPWLAKEREAPSAAAAAGAAKETKSASGEVMALEEKSPARRRKVSGKAPGTPKTRKTPAARARVARSASKPRASAAGPRKGRAKGTGVTRRKAKKNRS